MPSKLIQYGGVAAAVVVIAFGLGSLYMGITGHATVRDSIAQEQIVGTPDMTPEATAAAVKEAGLTGIDIPAKAIAGEPVDTGAEARLFAEYVRVHTLEATGGQVYAQMGRFLDEHGKPTSDEAAAAKDPKTGAPVPNGAREIWITSTALSTALQTSFFAENVARFGIVMGIALLLVGGGLLVVALGPVRRMAGEPRRIKPAAPAPAV
jgi:hypothetical protein